MGNKVTAPNIDASSIYEGGDITQITADELKGNIIGIRQLINSHNLVATESKRKDTEIQELYAENDYLRTTPFISSISATTSIIGSIIIGIATNLITNETQLPNTSASTKNIAMLICGGLLILISSFGIIFYPKARNWFKRIKNK